MRCPQAGHRGIGGEVGSEFSLGVHIRMNMVNDATRRAAGIALTDAQALQVLADSSAFEQWYQWSLKRQIMPGTPATAAPTTTAYAPPPAAGYQHAVSGHAHAATVPVAFGVLSVCALPAMAVLVGFANAIPFSALAWVSWVLVVIARLGAPIAGLMLGIRSIALARRAPLRVPRRTAALVLGIIGVVLSGLMLLSGLSLVSMPY